MEDLENHYVNDNTLSKAKIKMNDYVNGDEDEYETEIEEVSDEEV